MSVSAPTGIEEMVTRLLKFPVLQAEVLCREALGAVVEPGLEERIVGDIAHRQQVVGLVKYPQSLADNPAPLSVWLLHGYEEALDKSNYLRRAMECPDVPWEWLAVLRSLLDASVRSVPLLRALMELAKAQEGGVA